MATIEKRKKWLEGYYRNRDKILKNRKEWYRTHPEEARLKARWSSAKRKPMTEEQKARRKAWEAANKEKIVSYMKEYREKHKELLAENKLSRLYELKRKVMKFLGGKCACCGETIEEFLTIDHIHGRMGEKSRATGKKLWSKVHTEGCPTDKYQLLCFNCNCAKGIFGTCPHTWIRKEEGADES